MNLYLDDSGTRHPDRDAGRGPAHGHDWFGIGGVLLHEDNEPAVRARHAAFCAKWNVAHPLHSAEIRARSRNFTWLTLIDAKLAPDERPACGIKYSCWDLQDAEKTKARS